MCPILSCPVTPPLLPRLLPATCLACCLLLFSFQHIQKVLSQSCLRCDCPATCCLLLAACYLLPATCCLRCLLSAACCLLLAPPFLMSNFNSVRAVMALRRTTRPPQISMSSMSQGQQLLRCDGPAMRQGRLAASDLHDIVDVPMLPAACCLLLLLPPAVFAASTMLHKCTRHLRACRRCPKTPAL